MAEPPRLRIGQVNLGGSIVATQELPSVARGMGLDLVLVQEQYSGEPNLLQIGQHAKAGILACRSDTTICGLAHLFTPHCLVGHVEPCDVHVLSCYFQYSEDIDRHLDHLDRVLNTLRGKRILIGVDCNAHSPLWFCERRQYTGRGPEVEHRRQRMEGFVLGRDLIIHNQENQPRTFAGPSGESNIDLTLSTKNLSVTEWTVNDQACSSDHRLITCRVSGAERSAARAQPADEPVRFRGRQQERERYGRGLVGAAEYGRSGLWPTFGGALGISCSYRETQDQYYKDIADSGNVDPWGLAYRAASGRCLAPRGVINGLALADGYACDTQGAMSGCYVPCARTMIRVGTRRTMVCVGSGCHDSVGQGRGTAWEQSWENNRVPAPYCPGTRWNQLKNYQACLVCGAAGGC
ncbi:Retrovirus-related Pol polyprotein from type-1 retrotransposable element R1 [Eumeta japonica]|uniref:Retrovirus-related Pol polyprotein from type-1 retrotransposable element R1 n=1 Tax=Eumeta variegata TaxID=151549 RepID=A0A4C2ADS9_EUMVA|nr:Retrovirus-related Pol polyprotein from type-1 retrotransposable element R1 [Eumeta japonica]